MMLKQPLPAIAVELKLYEELQDSLYLALLVDFLSGHGVILPYAFHVSCHWEITGILNEVRTEFDTRFSMK